MRAFLFFAIFAAFALAKSEFVSVTSVRYDEQKARLGKDLFFDKRLSKNETYSCETCHNLYWDFSGTIRKKAQAGALTPPSILNAGLNFIFFKDGRARSLKEQVKDALTSQYELNSDESAVVKSVEKIAAYKKSFKNIYEDGVNFKNIVDAIAEFEKAVTAVNSPFDKFLAGQEDALNDEEKAGFEAFKNLGCASCHNGENLGGNLMHEAGFAKKILKNQNGDLSREKLSRVPSLRNIARSAPYLSGGEIASLKAAVKMIAQAQFDIDIDDGSVEAIHKFLLTLNGERPRILNESSSN